MSALPWHSNCFYILIMGQSPLEIIEFLEKVPPFQFLDDDELRELSGKVTSESYPRGSVIHREGGPPSKVLNIIKQGGVRISIGSGSGEEVVIDYRGEGDSFGFLSLASGDKTRTTIVSIDDTVCYQVDKGTVLGLIDRHPHFTEFFLKSFFNKFIDRTFEEMKSKRLLLRGGDKLLFTTQVGELIKGAPVTAPVHISIKQAALSMSEHGISSLVLLDGEGVPAGIVTDRDLRAKVVARERDVNSPASSIMSVTLIKSDSRAYCFEALLKMIRYGIHHLLIIENGRLKGVVTNHDFMTLQGTSPLSLVHEIESQSSIEGLVPVAGKINEIVLMLLHDGARADNISRILTEVNDRLLKRVLEIAEMNLGPAPLPYCWIAYGSEGRREQTFKTDQDNAIIYADPSNEAEGRKAEEYFGRFASFVNDALIRCGFAECPGDYMARNPKWRKPFSSWKQYFTDWISTPTAEAVLFSVILFDFRPIFGETGLAERLRDFVSEMSARHGIFLKQLADMAVRVRPPLGFFSTFVVEKDGEHKDQLNLKFKCLAPLINIIRLFALERGVRATSSMQRLRELASLKGMAAQYASDLEHALEFVMLLRIHHQFEQISNGLEPDNFIDPRRLSTLERRTLKEACRLISSVQDAITKEYSPGMVM